MTNEMNDKTNVTANENANGDHQGELQQPGNKVPVRYVGFWAMVMARDRKSVV